MSSISHMPKYEPSEGAQDFLDRVDKILPILKANAAKSERLRQLADESFKALRDGAGVLRALKPRRFGGLEIDAATWFEANVRIGTVCPSAAWVSTILGGHSWHAAMFSEEAQQEFWGNGQDCGLASSFAPTGKIEKVDHDSFRVVGRWNFCSGVDHSDWVMVGGVVPDDGNGAEFRTFVVPKSDFEIDHDSWKVDGLGGTGSKGVVIDSIVPGYRTQTIEEVYKDEEPGKKLNSTPIFQLPWLCMFSYAVATPAIGAALGALQAFTEVNSKRVSPLTHAAAAENPALHTRLAEAATIIWDAHARVSRTWESFQAIVAAGEEVSVEARVRARFDAPYAVKQCLDAVMKILEVGGGASMHEDNVVQRHMRHIMAARNHPFNNYEMWAKLQAVSLLGYPINPPLSRDSMRCLF